MCVSLGKTSGNGGVGVGGGPETERVTETQRNLVMAINTNSGLPSLPSAAAVDHAGVTVSFLALHHSLSP